MRVDLIGWDYEREISQILLMVEPEIECHGISLLRCVHGNIALSRV